MPTSVPLSSEAHWEFGKVKMRERLTLRGLTMEAVWVLCLQGGFTVIYRKPNPPKNTVQLCQTELSCILNNGRILHISAPKQERRVLLAFPGSHSVPSAQGVCSVWQLWDFRFVLHHSRLHCTCSNSVEWQARYSKIKSVKKQSKNHFQLKSCQWCTG